ncbi:MAG: amino acid permease [Sandaracinaceae bacterium]|nr:amino acid permease [Sandaracinaceae bacterium]
MDQAPKLERRLGVFSASTLIVGSMIGSGIFIAPSIMAGQVASPGVLLGLWVVGGVLTLLGALSYAELAAMMPHAGGHYVFLREAFGPAAAFLYGWTLFLVIQTGFHAAVSIAFAKYLGVLGLPVGEGDVLVALGPVSISSASVVACVVIALLTLVNCLGVKEGSILQDVLTVLKVAAVVALIGVGLTSGAGSASSFTPLFSTELGPAAQAAGIGFLAATGVAMSKALFAYDAWNTVTFAAGEVRDPARNLPRALFWGTLVTTLAYTAAAATYLFVLAPPEMAAVRESRVAAEVATIVLGPVGLVAVVIAILISTFGCTNGLILGGARVFYAMARDGLFFRRCARVHPRRHTPVAALVLQGIWSCVLALSGSYDALLTYVTFASLAFNALTVLGLFALRRSRPEAERPYRVSGYPVVPLLYLLGAGFFLLYIFAGAPRESLIGVALVVLGVPAYLIFRRGRTALPVEPT